jgi:hypothetical protein
MNHEPCGQDEIFLCNAFLNSANPLAWYQANGITTCRLGDAAFDIRGRSLPGYAPVFINKSELPLHQRLRAAQLAEVVSGTRNASGQLIRK